MDKELILIHLSQVTAPERSCKNCILREAKIYCPKRTQKEREENIPCEKWDK